MKFSIDQQDDNILTSHSYADDRGWFTDNSCGQVTLWSFGGGHNYQGQKVGC
jgi:hypothetical protein